MKPVLLTMVELFNKIGVRFVQQRGFIFPKCMMLTFTDTNLVALPSKLAIKCNRTCALSLPPLLKVGLMTAQLGELHGMSGALRVAKESLLRAVGTIDPQVSCS